MFRSRPEQSRASAATTETVTREDGHVTEAVPIVAAHIDEELLTRKKYLEENLQKQTEELIAARTKGEEQLREAYQKQGAHLRTAHFDGLAQYQKDLDEKSKKESKLQSQEEAEHVRKFEKACREQEQAEERLKQKYSDQRQARSIVSWLLTTSSHDRYSFETEERNQRHQELESIEDSARRDLVLLEDKHQKEMEKILHEAQNQNAFWNKTKPVLISAMLGGVVGLVFTPRTNL